MDGAIGRGMADQEQGDLDVAIVGAGAAGVAAARRLLTLDPSFRVRVFEAADRPGGRSHTIAPKGFPIDLGCEWLHGGPDNVWTGIAESLGLTVDRTLAPWDGARRDFDMSELEALEARKAMRAFFDRADAIGDDEPDTSLAAMIEPGGRWNAYIDAVSTFINGTELQNASRRDYARYEPGVGPDHRVPAGYGFLIETFAAGLPVALRTPVRLIDHGGPLLRLSTDRGDVTARAVIVTVSTAALTDGTIRFAPDVPETLHAATRLPLGLANKLFLAWPEGVPLMVERHRFGSTQRVGTGAYHLGPFGYPVIEGYYGGALALDLERGGQDAMTDFAREELAAHLGWDFARALKPIAASGWAGTPWIGGSYSYAKPGASDGRATLATPIDGRLFFAGEASSRHRFSTAHGAYETGVACADAIAKALA